MNCFLFYLYFSAAFFIFTVSRFSSPESPWLPARDRFGDLIPAWDPFRDLGSLRSSCQRLVFPLCSHFSQYSHFLLVFPPLGATVFGISPLPPLQHPQGSRIPSQQHSQIPSQQHSRAPRPRPPRGHLRDHEGSPKGIFFPGIWGFFPSGGWFGPGSAGIPAFPVPSVPGHCAGISRCLQEQSLALPRAIPAPFGPFLGILLDFSMDFCSFPSPPGRRSGSLQ